MLTSKFEMKDLGIANLILGIKIHRIPQGLALSQTHYNMVLEKFKYLNFKVENTQIDVNLALTKNKGQSKSQSNYARVLGSLMS